MRAWWILGGALLLACSSSGGGNGGHGTGGAAGSDAGASDSGGAGGAAGGDAGGGTAGSAGTAGDAGAAGSDAGVGCDGIPTFADGIAPTKQIHVDVAAASGGDGSAANPLSSIADAIAKAAPGTSVVIHAGTYPGDVSVSDLAGTAAAPIWIGGAAGETPPLISGGTEGMHLSKVHYLVLHDLSVEGATGNGINMDDGGDYANADATAHILFQNVDIHDIGNAGNQDCLKLSGVNDYLVLDSSFARCGFGGLDASGIDHVGCHHGLIARSQFFQMSGNAVQTKGGSEDIEIRWNTITDGGERALNLGGSTGPQYFRPPLSTSQPNFEAKNIRAIANVITGGTAAIAFVGCTECLAANNTVVDPQSWILRILQETTTDATYTFLAAGKDRVDNNIFYFDRSQLSTWINVGGDTEPATFTFTTNLWYAHDDASQSEPTNLPVTETGGVYGKDPALADPTGGTYTIDAASPAAGAGTSVAEVSGDFSGTCYATPPSIGAFEAK